jgi:hypothetical protein
MPSYAKRTPQNEGMFPNEPLAHTTRTAQRGLHFSACFHKLNLLFSSNYTENAGKVQVITQKARKVKDKNEKGFYFLG